MKYLIVSFFVICSFVILLKALFLTFYPDFNVYYYATKDALHHINPYTKIYFTGFAYPPTVLPILIPFTLFPFSIAEKIWTTISLLCLFISLFTIFRTTSNLSLIEKLSISGLVFLFFPVKFTLGMGQINLVVLLFISLGIYFYLKRINLSGVFFGLALLLKIFPVLFLVYFILLKKWRLLGIILLTCLAGTGLTLLLFGYQIFMQFINHNLSDIFFSQKTDYYNQALSGFLGRSYLKNTTEYIFRVLITAILILITFFVLWVKKNKSLGFSLLLALSLITNTYSWQHHFVWLIPAFIFTYAEIKRLRSWFFHVFLGLSYLLVAYNMTNPHKFPTLIQSHVFYGVLMLWVVILLLMLKEKS